MLSPGKRVADILSKMKDSSLVGSISHVARTPRPCSQSARARRPCHQSDYSASSSVKLFTTAPGPHLIAYVSLSLLATCVCVFVCPFSPHVYVIFTGSNPPAGSL